MAENRLNVGQLPTWHRKKGTEKSELNLFVFFRDSFFYFAILDILKMSNLHIRPKKSAKRLCKLCVYPNLVGSSIENKAMMLPTWLFLTIFDIHLGVKYVSIY